MKKHSPTNLLKVIHRPASFLATVFIATLICTNPVVFAQTQWTNTDGGDWSVPGNWSAGVPDNEFTSFANGTYAIDGDVDGFVSELRVNTGQNVTMDFGSNTLTLSSFLDVGRTANGGSLTFSGNLTTTAQIRIGALEGDNNGTLTLTGGGTEVSATTINFRAGAGGTLNVQPGVTLNTSGITNVGDAGGAATTDNNTININNATWNASHSLAIARVAGQSGNGVNVSNGGTVAQTDNIIRIGAHNTTGTGTIGNYLNVTGSGTSYTLSGEGTEISIGGIGTNLIGRNNYLRVADGATFTASGTAKTIFVRANSAGTADSNRLEVDDGTFNHNGAVSNLAEVRVINGGSLTVDGAFTSSGSGFLTVDGATSIVRLDGGWTPGTAATPAVGNGTIRINGNLTSPVNQTIEPNLDLNAGTRTLTVNGDVLTLEGSISNGGIVKDGNGRLYLTGDSSYSGNTQVAAGTLLVNNTTGSGTGDGNVTVQSGARIGGDGSIAGNLSLDSGAEFVLNLSETLTVDGTVSLDNSFGVESLTTITGSAIDWSLVGDGTYTLIGNNSDFSNITNFGPAFAADIGDGRLAYFQNGSLQLVVIPEPASAVLIALITFMAVGLYRRRLT